jgi:hypothetical protein
MPTRGGSRRLPSFAPVNLSLVVNKLSHCIFVCGMIWGGGESQCRACLIKQPASWWRKTEEGHPAR